MDKQGSLKALARALGDGTNRREGGRAPRDSCAIYYWIESIGLRAGFPATWKRSVFSRRWMRTPLCRKKGLDSLGKQGLGAISSVTGLGAK
jgi:hypothetical protein